MTEKITLKIPLRYIFNKQYHFDSMGRVLVSWNEHVGPQKKFYGRTMELPYVLNCSAKHFLGSKIHGYAEQMFAAHLDTRILKWKLK